VLFNAQAAAEAMKAQGRPGSIVLMASMGGIAGAGFTVGFSTSKGGVVLMAKGPRRRAGTARHPSQFRRPRRAIDTQLLRATPEIARAAEGFRQTRPATPARPAVQGRRHDRLARLGFV